MGYIYAYSPDVEDCSNIGLVGALMPKETEFEIQAGEFGEFTMVHPIDEYGKWMALQDGVILKMMVPVRLAPEIKAGAYVATVEKWKVSNTATKAQRYIYSKSTGGKKTKLLSAGTKVTVVSKGTERYKVKTGKYSGWMDFEGLEFEIVETIPPTQSGIEQSQPSYAIRQQLFRIYEVIPSDGAKEKTITVRARRIVYDLLGNISTYRNTKSLTCQQALDGLLEGCVYDHPFIAYTDIGDSRTAVDFRDMNPVQAMIDPAEGIAARWGGEVICDDYDIYILRRAGMNRGVSIEYRKNMIGVKCTIDTSKVANAIRPRGETKSGEPLYLAGTETLPDGYHFGTGKQSDVIIMDDAQTYAVPKILALECEDCTVGDEVSTTLARRRMVEQSIALFESGCAVPEISLDVEFVMLGDTDEFAQYRHLEPLFVYDTVSIKHPRIGVYADVQCCQLKWDPCRERVISSKFGALTNATATVANWQINSVSGSKIIPYSIGSRQMSDNIINARHVQAESINAKALQAESVTAFVITALSAYITALNAGTITTDELYAAFAHIISLAAEQINAGNIETDQLSAQLAEVVKLTAGTAEFDLATVKNLVARALTLREGVADSMYIANLAITSANILNATLGELIIKGEDGLYYRVVIGTDGNIRTENVTLTDGEIEAGQTDSGYRIVETAINVQELSAQNIRAAGAIITEIFTEALEAGKITATQASIGSASVPELYTAAIKALGDVIDISANHSILLSTGGEGLSRYLRLDANDGLHIGVYGKTNEVFIDDKSVNVRMNNQNYSQFAANYVQFGNYQLRKSADGGLVFKMKGV